MIRRAPTRRNDRRRALWPYLAGIAAILLIPLLLTAFIAWRGTRDAESRVLKDRLALAQATALTASSFVDAHMAAISALARSSDVTDLGGRRDLREFLARTLDAMPDWESVEIFQANGWSIVGAGPGLHMVNIADRPYFQQAKTAEHPVVGPAGDGHRTGGVAVPVVVSVNFDNGASGALVVWLSTTRLDALLAGSLGDTGVQGMLLDSSGHVFARSSDRLPTLPATADMAPQGSPAPAESSVRRSRDGSGLETLIASAPVPAAGWQALVLQPADVAFAPIRRQLMEELIALGFAAAIVALIALFLGRRLSRSYEVELEAMGRVDQFVTAASHDLKSPLTVVKTMVQLMHRRVARASAGDQTWVLDGLDTIDTAVNKMTAQINEMLDLARTTQGRPLELSPRPMDLVALARRVAKDQQQTTTKHEIKVDAKALALVGQVDPMRLERALANLVENAIKYSPMGGEVVLGVGVDEHGAITSHIPGLRGGEWAVISVRDQGMGIPQADLPHIFDPFHRAGNTGRVAGTGIGLAGVRQIIELHGGTITAESIEGKGTTFTIRLPLAEEASASAAQTPTPMAPTG